MVARKDCVRLCRIMGSIATGTLLPARHPSLQQRFPAFVMTTRTGHGAATYCRTQGHNCLLTFGWKMVAEKFDRQRVGHWLTAREILERGYFDGELAVDTVLAQTVLHEFAHVLTHLNSVRRRGSVHNTAFYRELDALHHGKDAQHALTTLRTEAGLAGVALDFESPSGAPKSPPRPAPVVGDTVCFMYRGIRHEGTVERVNRKTLSVITHAPDVARWRVSPEKLDQYS